MTKYLFLRRLQPENPSVPLVFSTTIASQSTLPKFIFPPTTATTSENPRINNLLIPPVFLLLLLLPFMLLLLSFADNIQIHQTTKLEPMQSHILQCLDQHHRPLDASLRPPCPKRKSCHSELVRALLCIFLLNSEWKEGRGSIKKRLAT